MSFWCVSFVGTAGQYQVSSSLSCGSIQGSEGFAWPCVRLTNMLPECRLPWGSRLLLVMRRACGVGVHVRVVVDGSVMIRERH